MIYRVAIEATNKVIEDGGQPRSGSLFANKGGVARGMGRTKYCG
jgi:hypothetical protein